MILCHFPNCKHQCWVQPVWPNQEPPDWQPIAVINLPTSVVTAKPHKWDLSCEQKDIFPVSVALAAYFKISLNTADNCKIKGICSTSYLQGSFIVDVTIWEFTLKDWNNLNNDT